MSTLTPEQQFNFLRLEIDKLEKRVNTMTAFIKSIDPDWYSKAKKNMPKPVKQEGDLW